MARQAGLHFVVTGGFAGLALWVANLLGIPAWPIFLAWTAYGLLADRRAKELCLFFGFSSGVAAGILVVTLGNAATSLGAAAMPVALGLVCGTLAMLHKLPPLDMVPAYFIGMIAFFAGGALPSTHLVVALVAPTGLGILIGWLATLLISKVELAMVQDG